MYLPNGMRPNKAVSTVVGAESPPLTLFEEIKHAELYVRWLL